MAIYGDNISRQGIPSAGIAGPSASIQAMDQDLGDAWSHKGSIPTTALSTFRADNINNKPTVDSDRQLKN